MLDQAVDIQPLPFSSEQVLSVSVLMLLGAVLWVEKTSQ